MKRIEHTFSHIQVIVVVRVYRPFKHIDRNPTVPSNAIKYNQEIHLLATSKLSELRDCIKCAADETRMGDVSENPTAPDSNFRRAKEVPPPPPGLRARLRGQVRGRSDESGSSSDEAPPHGQRRGHRQAPPAPSSIPPETEPGGPQKPAAGRAQRPLRIAQLLTDSEDEEW